MTLAFNWPRCSWTIISLSTPSNYRNGKSHSVCNPIASKQNMKNILAQNFSHIYRQCCCQHLLTFFYWRISQQIFIKIVLELWGYSKAQGKLIHDKNLKLKISCQTPFSRAFLPCRSSYRIPSSADRSWSTFTTKNLNIVNLLFVLNHVVKCLYLPAGGNSPQPPPIPRQPPTQNIDYTSLKWHGNEADFLGFLH